MRRVLLLGFAALLLAGSAAPAFAEDSSDDGSNTTYTVPKQPTKHQNDDDQAKHDRIRELFDDITGVIIPPVAIKPGHRPDNQGFILPGTASNPDANADNNNGLVPDLIVDGLTGVTDPTNEYSVTKLGSSPSTAKKASISPTKSKPVQIKSLVLTKRTPTDEFMAGALYLGASLLVVAIFLLTMTSIQHLRLRKKP